MRIILATTSVISSLKSVEEEQDTEIIYYIGQEISKMNMTIEEYIEKIESVTREQIITIFMTCWILDFIFIILWIRMKN